MNDKYDETCNDENTCVRKEMFDMFDRHIKHHDEFMKELRKELRRRAIEDGRIKRNKIGIFLMMCFGASIFMKMVMDIIQRMTY